MSTLDSGLGPSRISRAAALARKLEGEIMMQALSPGARLGTKSELRERFGVAVATINEAVRLMESRGLVAARPGPGGGVFVAAVEERARLTHMILGLEWDRATFGDCVAVRTALEPLVCREAARYASKRDIEALDACVDDMAASLDDMPGYLSANWAFHRRTAALCRNAPLRSIYLTMVDFIEAGLDDVDFDGHDPEAIDVHRELAAAIGEGPGERLESAVRRHTDWSPLPSWDVHPRNH